MRRRGFLKSMGVAGSAMVAGTVLRGGRERAAAAAATTPAATAAGKSSSALARLAALPATLRARFLRYEGSHLVGSVDVALDPRRPARAELGGALWSCAMRASRVRGHADATDLLLTFKLVKGTATGAGVGAAVIFDRWSNDNYVLLPGACYGGNRFESRHIAYPPLLTEPADIGPNVPTIISDVPRLNVRAGASRIQLLAGDLATPAVGVQLPGPRTGLLLLTDQGTPLGPTGITVDESDDRSQATLLLAAPGVRQEHRYALGNTRLPSKDEGATFAQGAEIVLRLRLYLFDCPEIQGLFDRFAVVRKDLSGATKLRHDLPFSAAWKVHEEKLNRQNWVEKHGYYASGLRDSIYTNWQTGWAGGLVATQPLLFAGEPESRERALKSFDFLFQGGGQARSGFFLGISDGRAWFDDGFPVPMIRLGTVAPPPPYKHARSWHLVRRSGEALYFGLKQLALLEKQDRTFKPRAIWTGGLTACADAFVRLWDKYHQLGQFVNVDTGQLVVGGSTSAAIAPAGLALAARAFKKDDYLRVAAASGAAFHERFVRAGLTTGGPPDALQCPDSESAMGLLESFVVLYEVTGDRLWIDRAVDVAHQLATWAVSYDFQFPARSTLGRMEIRTTGAIFANAQNKHGSPGFFIHSGDALLRLYRATGRTLYLELLRDTAHNITQYLNRPEHLLHPKSEAGWMCERVNTSDWADQVGEIVPAPSPYEICSMLTAVEVPGLYVHPDTGFVFAFDHVDAAVKEKSAQRLVVTLKNPTKHEAAIRVLAENTVELNNPLGPNALWGGRIVTVPPDGAVDVDFARTLA
jgi:hypothetical protein